MISNLLISLFMIVPGFVNQGPKIDGKMENIWNSATIVSHFTQMIPDEGKPASESTNVYIMTDNKNLYVFFKCYADKTKSVNEIRKWDNPFGDAVKLYLDTFGDKRTCYVFIVSSAGTQGDAIITKGGEVANGSWNGVWFASSRITNYGYSVEMKIPFKSIKYRRGKWGIQFARYMPHNENNAEELGYWIPVKRYPGFRISQFAVLDSINPEVKGLNLGIYPVGTVKYDNKIKFNGGLDISYKPNDMLDFDVTVNPDYAQIEADPFNINLTRYALYLEEKRPFFVNGQELFTLNDNSSMGLGGIKVLYTRNIGKVINDTTIVPIQLGTKIMAKGNGFDGDIMYVKTGNADSEPSSHYIASKWEKLIIPGLTTGLIYTGKESENAYTRILTLENNFVKGYNNLIFQGSYADSVGSKGKGFYFNWSYMNPLLILGITAKYIDSTYNINEIGYNASKGKDFLFSAGHIFLPENRYITKLGLIGSYHRGKEWSDNNYSQGGWLSMSLNTRNNNSINLFFAYNDVFIFADTAIIHYKETEEKLEINSYISKYLSLYYGMNISYNYNYYANHLGYIARLVTNISYKPYPNFSINLLLNGIPYWLENAGLKDVIRVKSIENIYLIANPTVSYYISPKLMFELRGEMTWNKNIKRIYKYRVNPLFAYNLSPKSWLYFVYSLSKSYNSTNNVYETNTNVGEIKLRYLLYF